MATAAARVDSTALRALAEHYAALPGLPEPAAPTSDGSPAARIVTHGLPEANLPACDNCHAPGKRPDYPALAGQQPEYMADRLAPGRGAAGVVPPTVPTRPTPGHAGATDPQSVQTGKR